MGYTKNWAIQEAERDEIEEINPLEWRRKIGEAVHLISCAERKFKSPSI